MLDHNLSFLWHSDITKLGLFFRIHLQNIHIFFLLETGSKMSKWLNGHLNIFHVLYLLFSADFILLIICGRGVPHLDFKGRAWAFNHFCGSFALKGISVFIAHFTPLVDR